MTYLPFPIAGSVFSAPRAEPLDAARLLPGSAHPAAAGPTKPTSSRRRKLWELAHKFHCPLIGACFAVGELRAMMKKRMTLPYEVSDFALHTTAVGACEARSELAEALQRALDKRHQAVIRQFAAARGADAVRSLWLAAVRSGSDIPGALWAAATHPACDAPLEQVIYGDIHMIQHQVASGTRADLTALAQLRTEAAELRRQLAAARREAETSRRAQTDEKRALAEQLGELRAAQAGRDACIARLCAELEQLRGSLPELKERQALARRAADAEARALALTARCRGLDDELAAMRARVATAETGPARDAAGTPAAAAEAPAATAAIDTLAGKCVLCVGGRTGTVDAYRDVVERSGGRFLHHDGGLEESLHRIPAALAAADLVICQVGCISHNAYWRVKEQCKRSGKPCLFLKGAGITRFGEACARLAPADASPMHEAY